MRLRALLLIPLLLITGLLTACGQQAQVAPTLPPPPAPLPSATAAVVPAADDLADIPQGQTPEGYQALGSADAPVTLVMYSDFL